MYRLLQKNIINHPIVLMVLFIPDAAPDRTVVAETPDIKSLLSGYKGKEVAAQKANFENSIENIKKNTEYGTLPNGGKYALLEKPTKGR